MDILAEVQERVRSRKSVDSLASNTQATREAAEAVDIERDVGSAAFGTTVVVLRQTQVPRQVLIPGPSILGTRRRTGAFERTATIQTRRQIGWLHHLRVSNNVRKTRASLIVAPQQLRDLLQI